MTATTEAPGVDRSGRDEVEVGIRRLGHSQELPLPNYASDGSAGLDLRSAADGAIEIGSGRRAIVPTGFVLEIPEGFEGQIRPRSGRAWKQGLTVVNAPGTIDSDYRGEVGVLLINLGEEAVRVERGERIAQLVLARVPRVRWRESEDPVTSTGRGAGGFGSTGDR